MARTANRGEMARASRRRCHFSTVGRDFLLILTVFAAALQSGRSAHPASVDGKTEPFLESNLTPELQKRIDLMGLIDPRRLGQLNPEDIENTCFAPLFDADVNGGGIVSEEEYVIFVNELSDGYLDVDPYESYDDLPLVFHLKYIFLSCLCIEYGYGEDCCQGQYAGISTEGSAPKIIPTLEQDEYLWRVCSETQVAIVLTRGNLNPTFSPIYLPTQNPTRTPRVTRAERGNGGGIAATSCTAILTSIILGLIAIMACHP